MPLLFGTWVNFLEDVSVSRTGELCCDSVFDSEESRTGGLCSDSVFDSEESHAFLQLISAYLFLKTISQETLSTGSSFFS